MIVFSMQSTSESDEPIHIINVGIKFSKKEKFDDNTLGIKFQDFCKERVSNRNIMKQNLIQSCTNLGPILK